MFKVIDGKPTSNIPRKAGSNSASNASEANRHFPYKIISTSQRSEKIDYKNSLDRVLVRAKSLDW